MRLVEANSDTPCRSPRNMAGSFRAVFSSNQGEIVRNANRACDFEQCTCFRRVAHGAIDTGSMIK